MKPGEEYVGCGHCKSPNIRYWGFAESYYCYDCNGWAAPTKYKVTETTHE